MADKRQQTRVPFEAEVTHSSEENFYTGFANNISEGGLFITTHSPAPIGETVSVKFKLPNSGHEVEIQCIVRWARDYNQLTPDMSPGMGLEFVNLPKEIYDEINEFIENVREPMFHPED